MIKINLEKAKQIAHERRRAAREKELKPFDEIIMKQIPGNDAVQAEKNRKEIRQKYALLQQQMDAAQNVQELKTLLTKE